MDSLDLTTVSDLIAQLERDGKGVPVLLRQYLKLGGRILGFNVDPAFSNVVDCLLMVDLRQLEPDLLEKYLGKEGAQRFLAVQQAA
jgi:putative hemolysin